MLYDPRWEAEVKAAPTLQDLIAWLEKQPSQGYYDYADSYQCLGAQFLRQAGVSEERYVGRSGYALDEVLPELRRIAKGPWQGHSLIEWRFGAALERARKVASNG